MLMAALLAACGVSAAPAPCADNAEPFIAVSTQQHRMWLCAGGVPEHEYRVRLGFGGVGKTKEGDGKVPLGNYALGAPRPSEKFKLFIPIAYPTAEQRAQGYTGSAVGIHGPSRGWRWLGSWMNAFDTTAGCVAVASDQEIAGIADWVKRTQAGSVVLR